MKANYPGYYCEDCQIIMDSADYSEHNADHTLRKIMWNFIVEQSAEKK